MSQKQIFSDFLEGMDLSDCKKNIYEKKAATLKPLMNPTVCEFMDGVGNFTTPALPKESDRRKPGDLHRRFSADAIHCRE